MNVVATNAMSVGLHSLAVVGSGVAWVPESLADDDLRAGRLVLAGKSDWIIDTEIAIYRKKGEHRPIVERVWEAAKAEAGASVHPLPEAAPKTAGRKTRRIRPSRPVPPCAAQSGRRAT